MNQPPAPKIHLVNTPEYREDYSNSVQIRVNLWDFLLLFGRINQTGPEAVSIYNFQAIYVSPQQAKCPSWQALQTRAKACSRNFWSRQCSAGE